MSPENRFINIEDIFRRGRVIRGQRTDPVEEAIESLRKRLSPEAFKIASTLPVSDKLYLHTLWEQAEHRKRLQTKPANRGGSQILI